jgi:hypothetical protein
MRVEVRGAGLAALAFATRKARVPAWVVPALLLIWKLTSRVICRARTEGPGQPEGAEEAGEESSEDLLDVLLPHTERVWELYDEDAVEGLQAASEDPMRMAEVMRE